MYELVNVTFNDPTNILDEEYLADPYQSAEIKIKVERSQKSGNPVIKCVLF